MAKDEFHKAAESKSEEIVAGENKGHWAKSKTPVRDAIREDKNARARGNKHKPFEIS